MIRVMLVDDEPLILKGMRYIIDWESIGFQVVASAKNGLEALEESKSTPFDVLITDIKMPELTGLELIEALNEEKRSIHTIILSGFQEFDLVKKGLKLGIENYLLKPINETELISSLLHVKEKINRAALEEESILVLRDHSIWRWITGKMEYEEFKERIDLYPSMQIKTPIWMGLLKQEWEEQNEDYLHSLQLKIEKETKAIAVITPPGDILLVWSGVQSVEEREEEKRKFASLLSSIEMDGEPIVAVSDKVESFLQIHRVYRELEMTCELKMLLPDKEHRMAEQMYFRGNEVDAGTQSSNYLKQEILEMLANQDYPSVRAYFRNLFAQLEQDKHVLLMKSILLEFFFHVKNKFFVYVDYQDYVQTIYQILYVETQGDALKIVDQCVELIEDDSVQEDDKSPIIQKVLNHIHQHFSEDMSLKTLGHSFHINPIYLGQLFQKEVNCSFTKYLNKLRIDRAKKLLLNSHEKAGHIGKKVGYTDATYFYKQFKKLEDMTPSEWRKHHMKV